MKTAVFVVSAALFVLGGISSTVYPQKTTSIASPLGSNLQGGGGTVLPGSQGSKGPLLSVDKGRNDDMGGNKDDDEDKDHHKKPKSPKK